MSKAKHTPGPWHYVISESLDWDGWYSIIGEGSPDLAVAICSWSGGAIRDGIDEWGEEALEECRAVTLANARLLAAAPDLLNAAERALKFAALLADRAQGITLDGFHGSIGHHAEYHRDCLREIVTHARGEES